MEPQLWQDVGRVAEHLYEADESLKRRALIPISEDGTGVHFFLDATKSPDSAIVAIGPGIDSVIYNDICEFFIAVNSKEFP